MALPLRWRGWPSLFSEALGRHQVGGRRGPPTRPGMPQATSYPACRFSVRGAPVAGWGFGSAP